MYPPWGSTGLMSANHGPSTNSVQGNTLHFFDELRSPGDGGTPPRDLREDVPTVDLRLPPRCLMTFNSCSKFNAICSWPPNNEQLTLACLQETDYLRRFVIIRLGLIWDASNVRRRLAFPSSAVQAARSRRKRVVLEDSSSAAWRCRSFAGNDGGRGAPAKTVMGR